MSSNERNNSKRMRGFKAAAWIVAMVPLAWALAGCGDWKSPDDSSGKVQIDLRPLLAQMGDQSSSQSSSQSAGMNVSPQSVSSPAGSNTVTPVQTVIIGALVIAFTDTPIGPSTALTRSLQDNLKQSAINSVKFVKIVQLPNPDPFIEFDVPPPAASHWQIVVVGTRDQINVLDDVKDSSAIYYGFNVDANKSPYFLSGSGLPGIVTITLQRSCIAGSPPNGCAGFYEDRIFHLSGDMEILTVTVDGASQPAPGTLQYPIVVRTGSVGIAPCNTAAGCPQSTVQPLIDAMVGGGNKTVTIEATHQSSAGQPTACTSISPATNAAALRTQCGSQFYSTSF